jgi:murein DD-endopeptidase MepM/ murein hydrolase activator NlpD
MYAKFLLEVTLKQKKHSVHPTKRLTIICIPNSTRRPFQFRVSVDFLITIAVILAGAFAWSINTGLRQIELWNTRVANQQLLSKVRGYGDQLEHLETAVLKLGNAQDEVRTLLGMKTRKNIIEIASRGTSEMLERTDLAKIVYGYDYDTSASLIQETKEIQQLAWAQLQGFNEIQSYVDYERSLFLATPTLWPTFGYVSSGYGMRIHPITKRWQFHRAIDIAAREGTPIRAAADGVVVMTGWQGNYGRTVLIDHGHSFATRYSHNSQILVRRGQHVRRGQLISYMGSTGRSTGPHLDFEVWYKGKRVNPIKYLSSG